MSFRLLTKEVKIDEIIYMHSPPPYTAQYIVVVVV